MTITAETIQTMILSSATELRSHHEELSVLDAATGDGDHGTTIARAMDAVVKAATDKATEPIGEMIYACGWEIMCSDGGSTGPLYGSLYMGMGKATKGKTELTGEEFAAMFEEGMATLRKQTKAQPGDKTLIDALVPGVETLRASIDAGKSIPEAMADSAAAAIAGAKKTCDYQAKCGRARNLGERSIGPVDAGATSMSYLFAGFAAAL